MLARQVFAAALLLLLPLTASPAKAQITQQGAKLVGTGAVGAERQGASVAVSGNGNTAVVGGYADNSNQGAAWVFVRSGGVWSQQGAKLVGTDGAGSFQQQGWSVAVSADGNTAVVGGQADNFNRGAVWVYVRSGGVWSQQGAKLVGTGAVGSAIQGSSVAVSADGNTVVVGGKQDNSSRGAAWVYVRSGGVWSQQGAKLVGTDAVGTPQQGQSVALSADGNTAVVGGPIDNSSVIGQGAAWVFVRSGGAWSQQGAKLVGTGAVGTAKQGYSVAVSADGNTAVVSGFADNTNRGAAWVYVRSGGVWSQEGAKLVGTGAVGLAEQGCSVAVSGDGSTVVVGGLADNSHHGAAWVFGVPSQLDVGGGLARNALVFAPPRPNPATGQSELSFALTTPGLIRLAVYDVDGRLVRTLRSGRFDHGHYQVVFDLRDADGRLLRSGLYFAQLNADGQSQVRRIAIVK